MRTVDRRPSTVSVDGEDVQIEWDAVLGRAGRFPKAGDYHKGKIRVSHGMTKRNEKGTLLHELLHHLWERAGLRRQYSDTTEENVVDSLTSWLFETVKANPEVLAYLREE
jgi:hypothetical protein